MYDMTSQSHDNGGKVDEITKARPIGHNHGSIQQSLWLALVRV